MPLPFVPLANPPPPTAGGGLSAQAVLAAENDGPSAVIAQWVAATAPEPVPLGELVVELSAISKDASIKLSFTKHPASLSTVDLMQAFSPYKLGKKRADGKMTPPPAGPRRFVELLYEIEIARLTADIHAHASGTDQGRVCYNRMKRNDLVEAQGFFGVRGDVPDHEDNQEWQALERCLGRAEQKPRSARSTRSNKASNSKAVASSAEGPYDGGAFQVQWERDDDEDKLTSIEANIRNDGSDVLGKSYHFFNAWFDENPVVYETPPKRMYGDDSDSDDSDADGATDAEEVTAFEETFLQSLTQGIFEAYEDAYGARANFRFVTWRRDEQTPFRVERHLNRDGEEYGKMKFKYRVSVASQDLTGVPSRRWANALRKLQRERRADAAGPSAA